MQFSAWRHAIFAQPPLGAAVVAVGALVDIIRHSAQEGPAGGQRHANRRHAVGVDMLRPVRQREDVAAHGQFPPNAS